MFSVSTKPAWVITEEDFHIYFQTFEGNCPQEHYATKQRALLFVDKMRAEGRACKFADINLFLA